MASVLGYVALIVEIGSAMQGQAYEARPGIPSRGRERATKGQQWPRRRSGGLFVGPIERECRLAIRLMRPRLSEVFEFKVVGPVQHPVPMIPPNPLLQAGVIKDHESKIAVLKKISVFFSHTTEGNYSSLMTSKSTS
jgi:hypothetical protein